MSWTVHKFEHVFKPWRPQLLEKTKTLQIKLREPIKHLLEQAHQPRRSRVWVWYANNHTHELLVLRTVELTVKSALIVNTLLFLTRAGRVEKTKER